MSGYGWIKPAAQRLSDQRQFAGWRPATNEAASFSSRAMRVMSTLGGDADSDSAVLGLCYLLVWLYELDPTELDLVASSGPEYADYNTSNAKDYVFMAWDGWANDKRTNVVTRHIGRSVVAQIQGCLLWGLTLDDVEARLNALKFPCRKPGGRHPDTW